ncbi:MAG: Gfo/Idh/MocA family oxidoreductase [Bacteroidota bacterium]|nr:MAG: NAD-binding protein [Bacteroidota bacterium]
MKLRWGIFCTAKIGLNKVIPAMQRSSLGVVTAISSRSSDRAREAAQKAGIPKAYGSYEELLSDPDVDAIYNPLPNHLHVPWSIKALEAGKHVLCEKPIGMDAAEAEQLRDAAQRFPNLKIMEAFMYRLHPQWVKAKELVQSGAIGKVQTIHSFFCYNNTDPANIRNKADIGGGGLMDIGCYCISLSRFIFDAEPTRVLGAIEIDPGLGTDILTSGMLEFENGTATFTCATQLHPYQRVNIFGNKGRIEIEIPFNAPPDKPTRLWHHDQTGTNTITFDVCDQYTIQADAFARAVLENTAVPTSLDDAVANMKVIDAIRKSASGKHWVTP